MKREYEAVSMPQYKEYRYIVIDGKIYRNTAAKEPTLLARFFRSNKSA